MSQPTPDPAEQKKNNLRTALILLSVVLVFFVGVFVKMALLGH